MISGFDYNVAFSRNFGWLGKAEMDQLRHKKVAIAGLGGVGGQYCEVLARLGVGHFHIADMDHFAVENFNRQAGAAMSTVGRRKSDVMRDRILDINPQAQIQVFDQGISQSNLDAFLQGVDLYVDGLDFFVLDLRIPLFDRLRELKIPAITVAPIGMGAASLVFTDKSMSFRDYFGLHTGKTLAERALLFLVGLSPTLIQQKYVADRSAVDLVAQRVPSTPMGVFLCGGVAGALAVKVLFDRGPLPLAPTSMHFDAYLGKLKKRTIWFGYRNPLQKLKLYIAKLFLKKTGDISLQERKDQDAA
ncbi:MAG: ThiF family adenylyltransferase [Bdellovibrionaceae bacterium]|nr:ThiF family adenylyltransferase [Bdellovibrionales bacterium]MCB9083959.1 ThiF family adenylyltransferase [Pseudobdellovibrionaceae bacterium]